MKRYFTGLIFLLSAIFTMAENYYVVKVEGDISLEERTLKTGDKLTDESMIKFSTQKDKLYLLSPTKGYFLLSPAAQKIEKKEWVVIMKNAIIPQNKYYQTANRGSTNSFSTFDDIYDLMGFFRDDVLIIDVGTFGVNPDKLPLDGNNYLKFISQNNNQKIIYSQNDKSFKISGDFTEGEFNLTYHQNGAKKEIGNFNLRIVPRSQIAKELSVFFRNQSSNSTTSKYFEEVIPYINEAYGNTNMEVVKGIISKDLNVDLEVRN